MLGASGGPVGPVGAAGAFGRAFSIFGMAKSKSGETGADFLAESVAADFKDVGWL